MIEIASKPQNSDLLGEVERTKAAFVKKVSNSRRMLGRDSMFEPLDLVSWIFVRLRSAFAWIRLVQKD
jgi:hypothetical protein